MSFWSDPLGTIKNTYNKYGLGSVMGGGSSGVDKPSDSEKPTYNVNDFLKQYQGPLGSYGEDGKFSLNSNLQGYLDTLTGEIGKNPLDYDTIKKNETNKINENYDKLQNTQNAVLSSRGLIPGTPAYIQAQTQINKAKNDELSGVDLKAKQLQQQEIAGNSNIINAIQNSYGEAGGLSPADFLGLGQQKYNLDMSNYNNLMNAYNQQQLQNSQNQSGLFGKLIGAGLGFLAGGPVGAAAGALS